MNAIGRVVLVAALACGLGCARADWIDRTLVTVDVTGAWEGPGDFGTSLGGWFRFDLAQQGAKVKGTATAQGSALSRSGGQIEGAVAGDVFTFRMPYDARFEGELKVSGDEMTGQARSPSGARGTMTLRRVGSSSPPSSPRQ